MPGPLPIYIEKMAIAIQKLMEASDRVDFIEQSRGYLPADERPFLDLLRHDLNLAVLHATELQARMAKRADVV